MQEPSQSKAIQSSLKMLSFIPLQDAELLFLPFVSHARLRQKCKQPPHALQRPRDCPVESCTKQHCWGPPKASATQHPTQRAKQSQCHGKDQGMMFLI